MSATQRTNFFWSDWLGDQAVRRLTPAERGVWIDLLALAAGGSPVGYVCDDRGRALTLDEIARVTNAGPVDEVSKLIEGIVDKGAASRDRSGRLFNRRMVRDAEKAAQAEALKLKRARSGRIGGEHTSLKYFNKQNLPRQMPQRMPEQVPRQNGIAISNKNITSSETLAAREDQRKPLASSLVDSQQGFQSKKPSELSRAELDSALSNRAKA